MIKEWRVNRMIMEATKNFETESRDEKEVRVKKILTIMAEFARKPEKNKKYQKSRK